MRTRTGYLAATILLALVLCGCGSQLGTPIDPLPPESGGTEFRLGEGVAAMTRGPGYKSSPAWSPDGSRLGFIVDGYVVDQSTEGRDKREWTPRDFDARKIMWNGNTSILSIAEGTDEGSASSTIYRSLVPDSTPDISEVVSGVTASVSLNSGAYLISRSTETGETSSLALLRNGRIVRSFPQRIEGEVTGISISPERGGRVLLAVRRSGGDASYALIILDLSDGTSESVYSLDPGSEFFGAPQWSRSGIYFVASDVSDETSPTSGKMYRISVGGEVEIAPEVGQDFTASSISLSPDGGRLAIVGRRRPDAQTNLHLLDLGTGELSTLTTSDDMEIKNGSDDLAWSPDGDEIAFVARGTTSGTRIYPGSASSLLEEFYNVYRIPVS